MVALNSVPKATYATSHLYPQIMHFAILGCVSRGYILKVHSFLHGLYQTTLSAISNFTLLLKYSNANYQIHGKTAPKWNFRVEYWESWAGIQVTPVAIWIKASHIVVVIKWLYFIISICCDLLLILIIEIHIPSLYAVILFTMMLYRVSLYCYIMPFYNAFILRKTGWVASLQVWHYVRQQLSVCTE